MAFREAGANVLVVDDEAGIRSFMSDALGAFGYQAGAARNADEAFELVARRRFDLVISDLRLPGVTGLDFVARLRTDADLRRVREAGIAILHKPIQLAHLQGALDEALGARRA